MKKLIYIGTRIMLGNKKRYCYVDYDDTTEKSYFAKRLCIVEIVGSIVEAEVVNDGKTYQKSKVIGTLRPDDPQFNMKAIWSMENRLAIEEYEKVLQSTKEGSDELDRLIKKIKDNFWSLNRTERTKIARYVFEKLIQ